MQPYVAQTLHFGESIRVERDKDKGRGLVSDPLNKIVLYIIFVILILNFKLFLIFLTFRLEMESLKYGNCNLIFFSQLLVGKVYIYTHIYT